MARNLASDDIVEILAPDPSELAQVKRRLGWLGKSTRNGYARLYLNLSLTSYLEVREEDIVHTVSLASDKRPLGGTVVFLRKDAEIVHTRTTSGESQAEWLSGDIVRAVMGRGGPIGGFAPTPPGPLEFNPTWIFATIAILVAVSVICRDGDGGTDFTLTGDTLCTGGPGSC